MDKDLKNKNIEQLQELTESLGGKPFHANYIFNFIHEKDVKTIEDITPLSKQLREKLISLDYHISKIDVVERFADPDGTVKYLFSLPDGIRIESVLLTDDGRKTVCISTQAGCAMGCLFCATGKIKFRRNLSAGEIVSQVYEIEKEAGKINNVVYMGMGEPFLNYDAVIDSLKIFNHPKGRNIGIRHLTVSTCGLAEQIERFAKEKIQPRLAISLHGPDDQTRNKLMPVNMKCSLDRLFESIRTYQRITGNRVTFEYIMIGDVNDSPRHAEKLVKLLKGVKCNINLIEYNPHPGCDLVASSANKIHKFADYLKAADIETVIRFKRGQTIKAACGQLGADWLENEKK